MNIGERIKKRREELQMSQEDLAEKLGYKSRSSINKIEKNISDIPQAKIFDFAEVLKTTPGYLMGWENIDKMKDLNMVGIEKWINSNFLEDYQKTLIKEHFSELLLRYKTLVNKTVDFAMIFNNEIKSSYKPNSAIEIKERYDEELKNEIESLVTYIKAYTTHLAVGAQKRMDQFERIKTLAANKIGDDDVTDEEIDKILKMIKDSRGK